MTKKIAICNLKGGTGKTTTSILLATALADNGHSVIVYDADPQGSASAWAECAEETQPLPFTVTAANMHTMKGDAREDYVLIDCPPGYPQIIDAAIDAADFVLVPTGHSSLDADRVWSILETLRDMQGGQDRSLGGAVLMTAANPRTVSYREMDTAMREEGFTVAPVVIPQREAIKHMVGTRPEGDLHGYRELADYITAALS